MLFWDFVGVIDISPDSAKWDEIFGTRQQWLPLLWDTDLYIGCLSPQSLHAVGLTSIPIISKSAKFVAHPIKGLNTTELPYTYDF